ncbi:hypothetical protein G7054_g9192 [Neopestalotiopsis clavispora]|nr:hypothetical protein G7054_g9192 [Neopestalotiopsis clavispora]
MSSSGSDYRFQFEIAIVLVIGLLIYVFVSLAMVAGYHLWNIQSQVNTFQLNQKSYDSQPSNVRQNVSASGSSSTDYISDDEIRKLRNDVYKKQHEINDAQRVLHDEKTKNSRYRNAVVEACNTLNELTTKVNDESSVEARGRNSAALKNIRQQLMTVFTVE